jgi:hypothetical protein
MIPTKAKIGVMSLACLGILWGVSGIRSVGPGVVLLDTRDMRVAARGGAPECDSNLYDGKCGDLNNRCWNQNYMNCSGTCTACTNMNTLDRNCNTLRRPLNVAMCTNTTVADGCGTYYSGGTCTVAAYICGCTPGDPINTPCVQGTVTYTDCN